MNRSPASRGRRLSVALVAVLLLGTFGTRVAEAQPLDTPSGPENPTTDPFDVPEPADPKDWSPSPVDLPLSMAIPDPLGMYKSLPYSPDTYGALAYLQAAVSAKPNQYAGISNRGGPRGPERATVHLLVGGPELDPETQAAIANAQSLGMEITVDRQQFSLAQMYEFMNEFMNIEPFLSVKDSITRFGINFDINKVEVGVEKPTEELSSAVEKQSGGLATIIEGERLKPAYGRYGDTLKFYAGDYIVSSNNRKCTSGFTITNLYGWRYATTAAHCDVLGTGWRTNANNNSSWGSTFAAQIKQLGSQQFIGTPVHLDATLIKSFNNSDYAGYSFTGGVSTYSFGRMNYVEDGCYNCQVYFSGSRTGQKLGTLYSYPFCNVYQSNTWCFQQLVNLSDTFKLCQEGDSGGPVYSMIGDGTLRAAGLISASNGTGSQCSYTHMSKILYHWTSSLTTSY